MPEKKWRIFIPLFLIIAYLMGPHPQPPALNNRLPDLPPDIENYVRHKELQHKLRPDNQARVVWANDSLRQKTEYAILYLHGFSASQGEGEPVHRNIARRFGCNLYLSRLAEHGIDTTEQLLHFTADKLWESAKEAYAIASRLGNKVIVMGTSTGGTLGLMLAARRPELYSLILLSPNIKIYDSNAWLLNNPWGLEVARMVVGSRYVFSEDTRPIYRQYWNYGYRLEALTELEELLEDEMKPRTWRKVMQPTLMLYYEKDSVVNVDAMK